MFLLEIMSKCVSSWKLVSYNLSLQYFRLFVYFSGGSKHSFNSYIKWFLTSTLMAPVYRIRSIEICKKNPINLIVKFNILDIDIFYLKNRVGEKVTCFRRHAASVAWLVQDTSMSVIICLIRKSMYYPV